MEGFQRAWLRKEAHSLKPVVFVGQAGLSEAVEKAVTEALDHHELVKIKFIQNKEERRDICEYLSKTYKAELVSIIGNIGILYRPHADQDARMYHIPVKIPQRRSRRYE